MADIDINQAFAATPLFAEMSKRHLTAVTKLARRIVHKPGQEIAAEGRNALALHVVVEGSAEVSVRGIRRRELHPGDYFGEISMIDGQPRSATVVAGDDGVVTYALNRANFLTLVDKEPAVARAVMVALCGRIRAVEQSG